SDDAQFHRPPRLRRVDLAGEEGDPDLVAYLRAEVFGCAAAERDLGGAFGRSPGDDRRPDRPGIEGEGGYLELSDEDVWDIASRDGADRAAGDELLLDSVDDVGLQAHDGVVVPARKPRGCDEVVEASAERECHR